MLGIHITVTVAWQRASSCDWTGCAAEISQRVDNNHTDNPRCPCTTMFASYN